MPPKPEPKRRSPDVTPDSLPKRRDDAVLPDDPRRADPRERGDLTPDSLVDQEKPRTIEG